MIVYPENPEETQVIVGSMNMGYISDTCPLAANVPAELHLRLVDVPT